MISIQKATPADALLISDLGAKTFIESHGNSAPSRDIDYYVSRTYSLKTVEEELSAPENIFHVIYYKGQAVGFSKIIFNSTHPLLESFTVTKLERLYLVKEFYGLKLGLTLFELIMQLSKKENQTGIWLYVWTQNQRALTFYKTCGFSIFGHADFKLSETHSNPNHLMYLKY